MWLSSLFENKYINEKFNKALRAHIHSAAACHSCESLTREHACENILRGLRMQTVVFGLFQSEKAGFLFSGQRRVGETRDIMKERETGLQMFGLGGPDCSSFQNQTSRNHKQISRMKHKTNKDNEKK